LFIAFVCSAVVLIKNKLYTNYKFISIAILGIYFLVYFNFLLNSRVAVHYTLFISIVFYIIVANAVAMHFSKKFKIIFWCLLALTFVFNNVQFYQNSISYINEILVQNKRKHFIVGPAFFGDPLDTAKLASLQKQYNNYSTPPLTAQAGNFITTTSYVCVQYSNVQGPHWLLQYRPTNIIDDAFLLYNIP
jgi:hypothetical protein